VRAEFCHDRGDLLAPKVSAARQGALWEAALADAEPSIDKSQPSFC
jgi:hypothetical protein